MVDGKLQMQIRTVTKTGLDEVMTPDGFFKDETVQDIEHRAAERLQADILTLVHKMQQQYDADIFLALARACTRISPSSGRR
ncbi:Ger(x)C family spore germination C-terminal domain-containing protein [Paenibacillus rhizoplanae]